MKATIDASVGRGGDNLPEDVGKIQSLLNATGLHPPLDVNCQADERTIQAITEFQYRHTLQPDGRIDPDGPTLSTLNRAHKVGDMPVPDHSLVRLLGYGAFGEVWMAQTSSGVKKALKLIPLDRSSGWKEFKGVFRVRDIRNPCLVSITDVWLLDTEGQVIGKEDVDQLIQDATSSIFGRGTIAIPITKPKVLVVAMQLCDKSLYNVLEETGGKGIAKDKLLRFMEDTARGLDYLNSRQHQFSFSGTKDRDSNEMIAIRHCDVKPENIMVVGGCAQVCDFGLAQIARAGGVRKRTGQLHASIYYAAPEMLDEDGVPTETTDQYSLALTYYHLRTGDLPFHPEHRHSLPALLGAHTQGLLDLSQLPENERKVIRKATSVNPKRRYSTCGEMVRELKGVQQVPWWRDRGFAVAAAAILLSAIVGLGLLVQDRFLGPRQRLAAAVGGFNEAAITCENLNALMENYTTVLQDHKTLQNYSFIREDIVASQRELLTKILAGAEVWLNETHDECPMAATTIGTLLDNLVRHYTVATPDLHWDARFLQARQQVQQGLAADEPIAWLGEQHGKLARGEEGALSAAGTKLLLLEGLKVAAKVQVPAEESPDALGHAFATLEAIQGLRERGAADSSYRPASSGRQPWAWEGSWESEQLAAKQRTLFAYLQGYDAWWAQGRLTPEREELVTSIWGTAAKALLPDVQDQLQMLLVDASDARRNGDHGAALGHLLKARAAAESAADRSAALARVAAEELCIWLSFPDLFRAELTRRLSHQPPGPAEFAACETLRTEGQFNPLVRAVWAECRLAGATDLPLADGETPEPAAFVAAGAAEAEERWYVPYVEYTLALAMWQNDDRPAAAAHALRAFEEFSTAAAQEADNLLSPAFRRDRGWEILVAAARAGIPRDADFDARHLFQPQTEWFDEPLRQLEVAGALKADGQADAYEAIASFARAQRTRAQTGTDEWQSIAADAERVLGGEAAPPEIVGELHLVAADARTRSLESIPAGASEELLKIIENYASALRQFSLSELDAIEVLDGEDARLVYDEIVAPATRVAEAMYPRRPKGPPRAAPTPKEQAVAQIYRSQAYFLRKHPPAAGDATGAARDVSAEACIALDKSNEFELDAKALHEEALIVADLAELPQDRAGDRVAKLSSIAQSILDCATTPEQKALGHHIQAFSFLAKGREQAQASRDKAFEASIAAFDEADKLVPQPSPVRAMVLEGRSTARVEWAVSARPARATWEAWLKMAARDAEAASKIEDRRNRENAFNAWGNALEDLAYYCRVDVGKSYDEALARFQHAQEMGRQKGLLVDKPYLYSLVSAARCRLRRVRENALPSNKKVADELREAEKELKEALLWLDRLPTNDRQSLVRKAEALYWQGMVYFLRPQPQFDEVAERWGEAADLVRGTPDWPYRQLDLIQLWAESDRPELVIEGGQELLQLAKKERFEPRLVKEALVLLLNHLDRPYEFDVPAALAGLVVELSPVHRSEVYAEKCVLAYNKNRELVLRDGFAAFRRDLNEAGKGLPTDVTETARKQLSPDVLRAVAKTATARGAMQSRQAIEEVQAHLTEQPSIALAKLKEAEATLNLALTCWEEVPLRQGLQREAELETVLLETQNARYYLVDVYIGFATVEALTKVTAAEKQEARKKYDRQVTKLLQPLLANPRTGRQARSNQTNWNTILARLLPPQ